MSERDFYRRSFHGKKLHSFDLSLVYAESGCSSDLEHRTVDFIVFEM